MKKIFAGLIFVFSSVANAGLIMTDLGSNVYEIKLDPVTFTVTDTTGSHARLIFENFYTNNSTQCGGHISGGINWSVNGGTSMFLATHACSGVFSGSFDEFDPNDLFINFGTNYDSQVGSSLQVDDIVTISIDSMQFSTNQQRIMADGPFEAKLVHGARLIADSVLVNSGLSTYDVPEPSTFAIFALGMIGLVSRRLKKLS